VSSATSSTTGQLKAVVARLLGYTGPTGNTVNVLIGGRSYVRTPPADAPFPHVLVNKLTSSTDPEYGNLIERFELEVTVYGRSRTNEPIVDDAADLCVQALLSWVDSQGHGLTFAQSVRRDRIKFSLPADPETFATRLVFECVSCPEYLTSAH
jgi:hypothetical protein